MSNGLCDECGTSLLPSRRTDRLCPDCARKELRDEPWHRCYKRMYERPYRYYNSAAGRTISSDSRVLRAAYARGYADAYYQHDCIAPAWNRSHHGGTWGYQIARAYYAGYHDAECK